MAGRKARRSSTKRYRPPLRVGTLITDETKNEYTYGFRVGMQELEWSTAEPTSGAVNASYWTGMRGWRDGLLASGAGYELCLALGMHNSTPSWLASAATNPLLVSQAGVNGYPDFIWNKDIQFYGERWFTRVNTELGLNNYQHIRLTNPPDMEAMINTRGTFDAYGINPQGTGTQRPTGTSATPFAGWRPGDSGLTTTQITQWVDWYYDSFARMFIWQMNYLRGLGFTGDFEIVCPGEGASPSGLRIAIAAGLVGGVSDLIGMGACWHKLFEKLQGQAGVNAHCSSVGESADQLWAATDGAVVLDSSAYDARGAAWRMKRIAIEYGTGTTGENPGFGDASAAYYGNTTTSGMLYNATAQAQAAGYKRFYWAHAFQIGTNAPSYSTFQSRIAALGA